MLTVLLALILGGLMLLLLAGLGLNLLLLPVTLYGHWTERRAEARRAERSRPRGY
jgi:hypothetical protein